MLLSNTHDRKSFGLITENFDQADLLLVDLLKLTNELQSSEQLRAIGAAQGSKLSQAYPTKSHEIPKK